MDTEVGTDELQMPTGIAGAVVGVKTYGYSMSPNGGHQFFHEDLSVLSQEKPGMNHIAGGIVDNGMQVGFTLPAPNPDFWSMKEVGHPELSEILVSKRPGWYVCFQVRIPVQVGGPGR
jgi:hypothetical protein